MKPYPLTFVVRVTTTIAVILSVATGCINDLNKPKKENEVKKLFDQWQNQISNPITRTYNYYNNYARNMVIEVQDINDNTRYSVCLWECYPKTVGNIQLDYASKDVMKLSVGMQYKYWTAMPVSQLADGQKVPTNWYDKMMSNFSGFQQTLNETLGVQAGNFITGSAGAWAVSKLPGILKF